MVWVEFLLTCVAEKQLLAIYASRWAEQLLNLCAAAIANSGIARTQHLMWVLNDLASCSPAMQTRDWLLTDSKQFIVGILVEKKLQ